MIGKYEMHNGAWHLRVNGKVESGDVIDVPRPNATVHKHKVAKVEAVDGNQRICSIVPVTRERLEEVYGQPSISRGAVYGGAR